MSRLDAPTQPATVPPGGARRLLFLGVDGVLVPSGAAVRPLVAAPRTAPGPIPTLQSHAGVLPAAVLAAAGPPTPALAAAGPPTPALAAAVPPTPALAAAVPPTPASAAAVPPTPALAAAVLPTPALAAGVLPTPGLAASVAPARALVAGDLATPAIDAGVVPATALAASVAPAPALVAGDLATPAIDAGVVPATALAASVAPARALDTEAVSALPLVPGVVPAPALGTGAVPALPLVPGVIPALAGLAAAGFTLVVVANRDDPGGAEGLALALALLASQGVVLAAVLRCPHAAGDACLCRKPHLGLVRPWLTSAPLDLERSAVVGGSSADRALAANLGLAYVDLAGLGWDRARAGLLSGARRSTVERRTAETAMRVEVDLDGVPGAGVVATGLGFFDHMLAQLARHGGFALTLTVERGDLAVDDHHLVEDTALALGEALRRALGDRQGIERYGFVLPMDEALATVALDLSGRPHATFTARFPRPAIGGLATEMVPHFFRSLAAALGAALHVEVHGDNTHHMVEAAFKGVARALRQAVRRGGERGVPSTKGVL